MFNPSLGLDIPASFIKDVESFSPTPYLDSGGVPTIGYGTTIYPTGAHVTMKDSPIDMDQGLVYLKYALVHTAVIIRSAMQRLPSMNQWTSVLSLSYNMGAEPIAKSTLMKDFNEGSFVLAARQFLVWDHIHRDGKLVVLNGLKNRRQKEAELFLKADTPALAG